MFVYGAYDELVLCGTCPQWTPCPQWTVDTVDTVFSLVVRVTFPTLAASLPPAPATLATATDAPVTGYIQQILRSAHAITLINLS